MLPSEVHEDARGAFSETYRASVLAEAGAERPFVQENLARTRRAKGVLRGLHFQREPHAQEKLIQVLAGEIFDVAVDIRRGSPTLGQMGGGDLAPPKHAAQRSSSPRGFAHGYLTLSDDCAVLYKTGAYYAPHAESGLRWDDPALGIDWPTPADDVATSERDAAWPPFAAVLASLSP